MVERFNGELVRGLSNPSELSDECPRMAGPSRAYSHHRVSWMCDFEEGHQLMRWLVPTA